MEKGITKEWGGSSYQRIMVDGGDDQWMVDTKRSQWIMEEKFMGWGERDIFEEIGMYQGREREAKRGYERIRKDYKKIN